MAPPEHQQPLQFRSGFAGELGLKLHREALEGEGTDVEIRFGETSIETVHAHSIVLRTESDVFKVMLGERWQKKKKLEDGKTTIDLPEDNCSDFVLFLKLLYGFQGLTTSNFNIVLPVYKLVDKYRVDRVLRLCDEYFQFLIQNMKKLDAAKLLWMAKDHKIDVLFTAALEYVKTNLHSIWNHEIQVGNTPYHSWMDWDEATLIEIISTNGLKVLPNPRGGNFNWSENEYQIAFYTQVWLHLGRSAHNEEDRKGDEPPTHRVCHALNSGSSTRVFSKIRYRQMDNDRFLTCIQGLLATRLSKAYIADICVTYCAEGEVSKHYKEERDFAVDKRLRNI